MKFCFKGAGVKEIDVEIVNLQDIDNRRFTEGRLRDLTGLMVLVVDDDVLDAQYSNMR